MKLPCFGKCPANAIEQSKCSVKNKEEDIQELIPHSVCYAAKIKGENKE
jgi:hypothetical protein